MIAQTRMPAFASYVAATVLYGPDHTAVVLHPAGEEHENAVATRERLKARGYTVVPLPRDLAPFLANAPTEVCLRVRGILRTRAVAEAA